MATAVRQAIAGTLARHGEPLDLPEIDMDFAGASRGETPGGAAAASRGPTLIAGALASALLLAAAPAVWPHLRPLIDDLTRSLVASAPPEPPRAQEPAAPALPPKIPEAPPPAAAATAPTQAAPAATTSADVEQAHALLSQGKVKQARELLRGPASRHDVRALLALARSYDPNFLSSVKGSDAEPDAAEAERLYRDWFALSVNAGLVSGEAQLDKLIKSLGRQRSD